MHTEKQKTVFFLGAGFSCAAGAPSQAHLLKNILEYAGDDYGNPLTEFKSRLTNFFKDAFSLSDDKIKEFSLEDFFTPIDKCISENSSFRGYSVEYIKNIKNILSTLISIIIDYELTNSNKDKLYLDHFVTTILEHKRHARTTDHVSIITTNWDILLDRRFYLGLSEEKYNGTLDYGTTAISLDKKGGLIPPLVAMARGMFTIKLYKIHGSLNWLKCPSCNRLYVNPISKVGITEYNLNYKCRICDRTFYIPAPNAEGLNLEPQLVYPTFLKDLSNIHFNQIWNNTAVELSEASSIIFIGYSFPQADFEIRQLLARKVPDNCMISIVLNENNEETFNRYKNFFGRRELRTYTCGANEFVRQNMDTYI